MNGLALFNSNGDQFIITDLAASAYPSTCKICGGTTDWVDCIERPTTREMLRAREDWNANVVIFALSLYNDPDRPKVADTAIVTCKGCAISAIESYFVKSSTGIETLRRLLSPMGTI